MAERHLQTPSKFLDRAKNRLKKTFSRPPSRSSSQENLIRESASIQQAIVSAGLQATVPVTGTTAFPYQQDDRRSATLSRPESPLSSSGLSGSGLAQGQHNTPTRGAAPLIGPAQLHGVVGDLSETQADAEKSTTHVLSTAKDVASATLSFTEMLLKRLPDAIDANPVKVAFVDQALVGWVSNNTAEKQGIERYQMILKNEWTKLLELKQHSLIRKIAVHEEDKGKIADIFERINQAREQLVVVTGLRVHKTVLAIQEDLLILLLKHLEPSHAADHKYEPEGEQRQLLRRVVCTPGTRVRILGDIGTWANDESHPIYWLSGQGGSGKSTIANTIARRFEFAGDADDTIVLGANFFCSRQLVETRSATRIIRTIVYQLALKSKAFADAVRACGMFDIVHQSVRAQLEGLLIAPWKKAKSADPSWSPRFLVIIDALDEIDGMGGSEFLRDLFEVINKNRLPGLKFFVTSRADPNLVTHFQSFKDKQFCRLEQVPMEEAGTDILTYLNANLMHSVSRPELEKIAMKAAGLFIYAATVVKYVEGYAAAEHEERLRSLFVSDSENAEDTLLDSLYRQVILDARRRFKSQHYFNILYTFLCSAERTSTSVVAGLVLPPNKTNLALFPTEIANGVLESLHAVLYVENDKVLTYHKSFTDFMFDPNRAKEFWCNQAKHHRLLTNSCFHVMKGLKFNIANIESSFILDHDNSALLEAVKQNISPILSYSCRNWDYHLSALASLDSNATCGVLSEFLQVRALFWIEAMNLIGSCGMCNQMLRTAYDWVVKTNSDKLQLMEYLVEARSFALYFSGSNASSSTPHLYISALATWPRNADLCQGWKSHFPGIPHFTNAVLSGTVLMLINVNSQVGAVAFSPDGKHIVSGLWDKSVWVWDASTGNQLKELKGHRKVVTSVAFSPDGKHIVSGSLDKSVWVWDASTGNQLKELKGHTDGVNSVAFSPMANTLSLALMTTQCISKF